MTHRPQPFLATSHAAQRLPQPIAGRRADLHLHGHAPRKRAYPIRSLAEAALACRGRGGAGGRGGLPAVGWSVAAAERSGKVSVEVKTAAELRARRGGGGSGVPGPGQGPSQARAGRPRASRGPFSQQRIPGAPALEAFPEPGLAPAPSAPGPGIPGLPSRAPLSAARAPLTRSRLCVPGSAGSGHVPRLQAARLGRRVSATSPPPSLLGA